MNLTMQDDVRRLVALACEYGAAIDVVYEQTGDVRISVYPPSPETAPKSEGEAHHQAEIASQ